MTTKINNYDNFIPQGHPVKVSGSSHDSCKGTLKGSSKTWILKELENYEVAEREVLAQQLFHLLIPGQPETALAYNSKTKKYYILSEEVKGFRKLPENESHNFKNGTYTGLGQAVVLSMFLEEADLKNGNIGLNHQNQVIKIDGDFCFAHERFPEEFRITPNSIANLPYINGFYALYWLDVFFFNNPLPSKIVDPTLTNSPQFREEVNEMLFKLCLIPDAFLELFVNYYTTSNAQKFINLLKNRRDELTSSALQNPSFQAYLKNPKVVQDARSLLTQLHNFNQNNSYENLENDFYKMLELFPDVSKNDIKEYKLTKMFSDESKENHSSINNSEQSNLPSQKPVTTGQSEFEKSVELLVPKIKQFKDNKEAKEAAETLYKQLQIAGQDYFSKPRIPDTYRTFKRVCDKAIENARGGVLIKHRGWEKLFLAILSAVVTAGLAVGINYALKGKITMFSTDSAIRIDEIDESVKKAIPVV